MPTLKVHCYYHKHKPYQRVEHSEDTIELKSNGELPRYHSITYCESVSEAVIDSRFDPRADWDTWTSGKNPFEHTVKLTLHPTLGLTYIDPDIHGSSAPGIGKL